LLGLYGEVGSILTTALKHYREEEFIAHRRSVDDEFGDVLWYFAAVCRRTGFRIDQMFSPAITEEGSHLEVVATDLDLGAIAQVAIHSVAPDLQPSLFDLAQAAATALAMSNDANALRPHLEAFARSYLRAARAARISLARVIHFNIENCRALMIAFPRMNKFQRSLKSVLLSGSMGKRICR
jgi:hypothetical protein